MRQDEYLDVKETVRAMGYHHEIEWAENIKPCNRPFDFFMEYGWVVINSGMKNQIAEKIWQRVLDALAEGKRVSDVFHHAGKAAAIQKAWEDQQELYDGYVSAVDKMAYLQDLPWIGPTTKWHLAKNLGMDVAKPDRHLVRLAEHYKTTPHKLCKQLSIATGDRIATVDLVLWRACNLGIINSRCLEGVEEGEAGIE